MPQLEGNGSNNSRSIRVRKWSARLAAGVLQRAVKAFPEGTTDVNYAYALFNYGNALRLSGRPEEAIPVLEARLQIPNQTGTVQAELDAARENAGG